jgi:prepilin-type N-terminal cleavage/methylation domain-containing protein
MNSRRQNSEAGFTLIEVLISVVVLTFISLGIYQLTTQTFRLRDSLSIEGEFYNSIRLAMNVLGRDVAAIYTPELMKPPTPQPSGNPAGGVVAAAPPDVDFQNLLSTDAGRTTPFWLPAIEKSGLRPSHFIGTDLKISFLALSHVRIYRDAPDSIFAKISYELVHDENPGVPGVTDALMLVRTESTNAFDDDDRRDRNYSRKLPLLHGIKKLKYRYWKKDGTATGKWDTSWDNEKEDYKGKFPDLVEVTFEVIGPEHLSFEGIYKFRPEVPLRGLDPST